jgi:diadenosine tetraphosphate (Ap4A) HIT family hydrolase
MDNKLEQAPCPHCNTASFAFKHLLETTPGFSVVCDVHPLIEGHLLIIPKAHLSCIAEYPKDLFAEFCTLYERCREFVLSAYGSEASFEHGVIGQTVFHSHIHILPFALGPDFIVPEGPENLHPLKSLADLHGVFQKEGKYLYLSIAERMWTVNTALGAPRFFRDRFAAALGSTRRGNWKEMRQDEGLMSAAALEIARCKERWHGFR